MSSVVPLLVSIYSVSLGYFVIRSNRERVGILFALLCLATAIWQGTWAVLFQVSNPDWITYLTKQGYFFIIFLPTVLYHFLVTLSNSQVDGRYIKAAYLINVFLVIGLFSGYFLNGYYSYSWGNYPKWGVLLPVHIIQTIVVVTRGLYVLWKKVKMLPDGDDKKRLKCVLWGLCIYFLAAIDYSCNFGVSFYPPGVIFLLISLTMMAYAIVKYNLMKVKMVLSRSLALLISMLILVFTYLVFKISIDWIQVANSPIGTILHILFVLIWAIAFAPLKHFIQTPLEKKFLKGYYDIQQIISDLSTKLNAEKDVKSLLQIVSSELSNELETKQSYFFIRKEPLLAMGLYKPTERKALHLFERDHPFIQFFINYYNPVEFERLPIEVKESVSDIVFSKKSLCFPIVYEAQLHGIIILGEKLTGDRYSDTDFLMIKAITNQLILILAQYDLIKTNKFKDIQLNYQEKEIEEKKKMERDLQLAQKVQQRILPSRVPKVNNYHFEAYFRPLKVVSGDFYYFLRFSPTKIGIVLADVVGKGISAGFTTISFRNMIDKYVQADISPKECMGVLNNIIYDSDIFDKYIPIFYGILDTNANTLSYANAGHDPGLLYSKGKFTELAATGLQAGAMKDEVYEEHCVSLNNTDTLLLYTDGLVDLLNSKKGPFGVEGIQEILKKYHRLGGDTSFNALLEADIAHHIQGDGKYKDDITVIFIEHIHGSIA